MASIIGQKRSEMTLELLGAFGRSVGTDLNFRHRASVRRGNDALAGYYQLHKSGQCETFKRDILSLGPKSPFMYITHENTLAMICGVSDV